VLAELYLSRKPFGPFANPLIILFYLKSDVACII